MIEETLITYGPLGAWTLWLLYEKQKLLKALQKTIQTNTDVLVQACGLMGIKKKSL